MPRDQGFPLTLLTLANLIAGWHAALPIRSWRLVAAGAALLDRHGLLLAAWLAALTAFALLYQQRGAEGESPP